MYKHVQVRNDLSSEYIASISTEGLITFHIVLNQSENIEYICSLYFFDIDISKQ